MIAASIAIAFYDQYHRPCRLARPGSEILRSAIRQHPYGCQGILAFRQSAPARADAGAEKGKTALAAQGVHRRARLRELAAGLGRTVRVWTAERGKTTRYTVRDDAHPESGGIASGTANASASAERPAMGPIGVCPDPGHLGSI